MSAVQATGNAVHMATMADDAGVPGQGNCDGCGGGDNDADAATCSPVVNCSGMAAVVPVERGLAAIQSAEVFTPVSSVARDLIAPPDPYPPRSLDLD